jgi:catalase
VRHRHRRRSAGSEVERSSPPAGLARYSPAVAVSEDVSRRLVDAIHDAFGAHPGRRAAHARGTCCEGTFWPAADVRRFSRAAVFAGGEIRTTARFSNGSGDPDRPDTALDGRGLAVKFHLAGGGALDLVGLSHPVFFVRDVDSFIEFTRVRSDRGALEAWTAEHPEALGALMHLLTTPAAASYADLTYHGIHAFRLRDAGGEGHWARYRWVPLAPGEPLSSEARKAKAPDYLQAELRDRFAAGGRAQFRLEYQLALAGDPLDDPTLMWPPERQVVAAGTLTLDRLAADPGAGCERLVFDPLHLVDGIEPSADPILLARPGAYSISIRERLEP